MDCDGEGAESGEQQQSDEDDEEDDGACSVDLRAENSRLHRDLEAMTKERDLLRHFGPIVTQLQEENATITANVHAISQQLARLLDAQKAPAGAAQSSLPAPLPRPSSRPQASAQPTAGADPGLLPLHLTGTFAQQQQTRLVPQQPGACTLSFPSPAFPVPPLSLWRQQ
ncbi:MAG: hypothetical protein WDW38_005305 [Sanguina aurantia]